VDVAGEVEKVLIGIDPSGFEFTLKEGTDPVVFLVEIADICVGDTAHETSDTIKSLLSED